MQFLSDSSETGSHNQASPSKPSSSLSLDAKSSDVSDLFLPLTGQSLSVRVRNLSADGSRHAQSRCAGKTPQKKREDWNAAIWLGDICPFHDLPRFVFVCGNNNDAAPRDPLFYCVSFSYLIFLKDRRSFFKNWCITSRIENDDLPRYSC